MKGITLKAVEAIEKYIANKFDTISLSFLGIIPKITKERRITFSTAKSSLTSLFLQALGTRKPNKPEENSLKVILRIANNYMEALKERTQARTIHNVDAYLKENKEPNAKEIKKIISTEMDKAKHHLKLIANTESNKCINTGTALQISKVAESHNIDDPTVFFIVTVDDVTGSEEFILHLLPDRKTPRVWKLSEIGHEYHKKGDPTPKLSGLHPNCFVGNCGIKVLTEKDGYKNIKDIKIGDRVLSHTGKFKLVTNTLEWYNKKYYGKFIKIKYKTTKRDGESIVTLKVTPDHEFMTQRGWVKAKDLTSQDKFKHLYTKCATCKKKTEVRPKRRYQDGLEGYFCSRKCKADYQWSLESHKKNMSQKSSENMKKRWKNPTKQMIDQIRKMNAIHRHQIENGEFWAQQKENLPILQKNIAKINQKLQTLKISKEELELFNIIKSIFPTAKSQVILEKWCVDIFIPELKVNIEYDGGGHYLPVHTKKHTMESFLAKQEGRDIYLEKCGYHVLRYSEIPSMDKIKEDVIRVSKNYKSEYFFEYIDLISVETIKNRKGGYKLYDITVEDDESFVVNGIISHNCRCKLTYLAPNWGFNEDGKIAFKGVGWDEYKNQREKHGTPRPIKKSELDLKKYYYDEKYNKIMPDNKDKHGDEHPHNEKREPFQQEIVHTDQFNQNHYIPKHSNILDNNFDNKAKTFFDNQRKLQQERMKQKQMQMRGQKFTPSKEQGLPGIALNSLKKLMENVRNHPDRHVRKTNVGESNENHIMRLRHLYHLFDGKEGYSIKPTFKPNTKPSNGTFTGLQITIDRHPSTGKPHKTIWHWDGENLLTLHHGIKRQ